MRRQRAADVGGQRQQRRHAAQLCLAIELSGQRRRQRGQIPQRVQAEPAQQGREILAGQIPASAAYRGLSREKQAGHEREPG